MTADREASEPRGDAVVEIAGVVEAEPEGDALWGAGLNAPRPGDRRGTYTLDLRGWAIGRRAPVANVELLHGGSVLHTVPIDVERPHVAARYPDAQTGATIGFRALIGALPLAPEFEVEVLAVLESGERARIATVTGRRRPLNTAYVPRLQPLMVTTLGRTGSMLLMRLLEAHPEVLVHRPHRYEQRVAGYWIEVLLALAEPASYSRQLAPAGSLKEGRWWLGDGMPPPWSTGDDDMQEWLGRDAVISLAEIAQARIDALYERVAAIRPHEGPGPGYACFAEKHTLQSAALTWELYPNAREVFLVRDFRDMVSSILAFNRKRDVRGFGHAAADGDVDYVLRLGAWASELVRSWERRTAGSHLVRYEDLVLQPRETLAALLEYVGVQHDDQTVGAMVDALGSELPVLAEHTTSPDAHASVGRWEADLSDELKRACERSFSEALAVFGYRQG